MSKSTWRSESVWPRTERINVEEVKVIEQFPRKIEIDNVDGKEKRKKQRWWRMLTINNISICCVLCIRWLQLVTINYAFFPAYTRLVFNQFPNTG